MERRVDLYGGREMRHSKSEDLLGTISRSPSPNMDLPTATSEDDLIAASALRDSNVYDEAVGGVNLVVGPSRRILSSPPRTVGVPVDPEDSIRDIVTENDLYRSARSSIQARFFRPAKRSAARTRTSVDCCCAILNLEYVSCNVEIRIV